MIFHLIKLVLEAGVTGVKTWQSTFLNLFIFSLACLGTTSNVLSQNIVPNPSFEEYTVCPYDINSGWPLECTPWRRANSATPDYFNACSSPLLVGVPDNYFGYQNAHTGEAYTGLALRWDNGEWHEYLQVQLTEPLQAGFSYSISFYISLADFYCGISNMGAYFSVAPPPFNGTANIEVTPQFESDLGILNDTVNWVLIEGCFIAIGGEQWITIGNFYNNANSPIDPNCFTSVNSYYYVDDVSVVQGDPANTLELELGDPITTCSSYEIDPGVTDVDYLWSDDSTDPTLIVTESGTYALTITSECQIGIDSVEVFFVGVLEGVDLGPPEVTICNGDIYTISLDPSIGDYEWQDDSTDPDYSITTSGLYQVWFDDGCDITTDSLIVIVLDTPTPFDLGGDAILCEGDEIVFSFDPDMGDFEWQDGSTSSDYIISEDGIYELTISNICGEFSNDLEVIEILPPDIDLGPDQLSFCEGQYIDFSLDPESGDYLWQDGSFSSSYSISIPGIYSVIVTNECGTSYDMLEVILVDEPIFELLPDQSLCPGQTIMLDGSSISGNYLWQDSTTMSTFLVSQSGTYSLTVTNQCGSGSDSITVNYIDSLTAPDLGPDVSLCPGEQYVFYAGVTGVNYTWQDSSTADSLVGTLPGTYILQIANSCSTASDTVVITINDNPPVVDLPSSIDLCAADTVVIDAGISGVNYLWNDGTLLSSISVSDPGLYSITVSNACGSDVDTVVIVDAGLLPTVSLSPDLSICPGEIALLSPVSTDVLTWLWPDGSTGSTYNVSSPGIVNVLVSNRCGVDLDTILVSLLPLTPNLDLGADTSLCPGENLTVSINIPGVDIMWFDGSTGTNYNVTSAGIVHAIISNQCGSSSDSLDVMMLSPAPTLNLGMDQSLCPGETITLSPGISNVDYLWQDGSISPAFNAVVPGLIILSVSNSCGTAIDTLEITEDTDGPEVYLGEDVLACEDDLVTLSADLSGVNYLWQDGSTQPYFSTAVSGTFILQVSNACGADADTVIVDMSDHIPAPSLGPDTILCEGFSFQLSSHADAETYIEWQDGSTLPVLTVSSPGTYILSETNHCGSGADTIVITYKSAPEMFDLGSDTILCPGQFILLLAPSTTDLITWQNGSHNNSITADQELTYFLELSNQCGNVSDDLSVSIDEKVPVIHIDPEITWCQDEIITLDATQIFDASYQWNTGSTLPLVQVNTPGLYNVNVTTACHSIQQEIEIKMDEDCSFDFYIPSIFSPNGDQVNDVFTISFGSTLNILSMSCSIFDRWGNHVFNSHEINFAWDGRFRYAELPPGVYIYLISMDYIAHGERRNKVFSNGITLIR